MPVKPTPNGAGFASKPDRERRRRRVRHQRERHDDDRIAGARGEAGAGAARRQDRVELVRLQHAVDAVGRG